MADLGFVVNDLSELPDAKDFTPVPPNDYAVMIVNSKLKPTNKTKALMQAAGIAEYDLFRKSQPKAEGYLELELDIQTDGLYKGRKLFHNLNLINDSQQAAEIAAGQLKQILEALGMKSFSGKSEELHNKRMTVKVDIKQGNDYTDATGAKKQGQPQNVIKKFSAPGSATTATQTTASAASGGASKGPWAR